MCHGVDEVRECILREGEASSLETSCISHEALEVCTTGSKHLNGHRSQTHRAMLSQDIAVRRLLSNLTTLVSNTSAIPSGWMLECPLLRIYSDHIDGPLNVTCGVSA